MLEISNVEVSGLKRSVIDCRNAMRLDPPEYTDEEFEKSLPRAIKLVQSSKNSDVKCHDNFLTGITVYYTVKYPQYWTPEFQRYHFNDIITSSSKMHRLCKMSIRKATNKYVSPKAIETEQFWVDEYNMLLADETLDTFTYISTEDPNKDVEVTVTGREDALYAAFMCMVSNCPLGLELFMDIKTNYKQLQTMYVQRKHHKLKEDWGAFCKFVEELPYAKEFIL